MSRLLRNDNRVAEIPQTDDVLAARYMVFGNGDGSFSFVKPDSGELQKKTYDLMKAAFSASNPSVQEITAEQFNAALSEYPSFSLRNCVDIPGNSFSLHYGFGSNAVLEGIAAISEISFSDAAKESIFIADRKNGRFYRIILEKANDMVKGLRSSAALSSDVYYLSGSILGGSGTALMPLYAESKLDYTEYESEYDTDNRELRISMAEAVFGENFDFVRRMTDSFGNISYMYGYGQKVLSSNTDGSFEYTEQASAENSQGFFADLETAIDFACACGGWVFADGKSALRLADYEINGSGRSTQRIFRFHQYMDGTEICLENGPALSVTVSGGQVTNWKRSIAVIDSLQYSVDSFQVSDATNVVAENCNHIYNISHDNTLAAATDDALNFAADSVNAVSIAYFRSDRDRILSPCWKVETNDGVIFYFDLYTGSPLGFTK